MSVFVEGDLVLREAIDMTSIADLSLAESMGCYDVTAVCVLVGPYLTALAESLCKRFERREDYGEYGDAMEISDTLEKSAAKLGPKRRQADMGAACLRPVCQHSCLSAFSLVEALPRCFLRCHVYPTIPRSSLWGYRSTIGRPSSIFGLSTAHPCDNCKKPTLSLL
ncbi:hypothetical protein HPB48_016564 [Haemaphysalis longicornis]|uniref:Uncharacterized protein n=1 Tax=Haemaphysalis longicornis TaxID=44386 RepID=A0A9J6GT16_HAELO|nr:hypothetical protein HPB48_016564 [Haemaphysalis longicornis]